MLHGKNVISDISELNEIYGNIIILQAKQRATVNASKNNYIRI